TVGTSSRGRIVGGHFLDDKRLLVATGDGVLHIWKVDDGSEEKFLGKVGTAGRGVLLSANGKTILTIGAAGEIARVDVNTGKVQPLGDANANGTNVTIFLSPDGKKFVIAQPQKGVTVRDTEDGAVQATIPIDLPLGLKPACCFSPDGKTLTVGVST